jgi:transcriptional regulator with XRE-family HTH domain
MNMSIGDRLKMIRKEMELSQAKLADELSIHLRSYVSYEQGQRQIPQSVMLQLLEKGYNIHWLLTGEGNMRGETLIGDIGHPAYKVNEAIPIINDIEEAFSDNDLPLITVSDERIDRPKGNKDPFAYALKIGTLHDKSMIPVFSPQEIIILSPMETVMNNDKAIIKLSNGSILFRVMHFKEYDIELISANPSYPSITVSSSELVFAHKVIGSLKFKV